MIIRTPNRARYVIIDKRALEDDRLSWKARGVLSYLLSKPDSWEVRVGQLVNAGPTGRTAVRAALGELSDAGYIVRAQGHRADGSFDAPDVQVFEVPQVATEVGKPDSGCEQGEAPGSQPRSENPTAVASRTDATDSQVDTGVGLAVDGKPDGSEVMNLVKKEPPLPPTADAVGGSTNELRSGMRGTGTSLRERRDAVNRAGEIAAASRREQADLERKVAEFPRWPLVQGLDDEHEVRRVAAQVPGWGIEHRERALANWRRSRERVPA